MAWTAPSTWVAAVLTAAQLNQQLRDNMLVLGLQRRLTSRLTAAATNGTVTYAASGLTVTLEGGRAYHIRIQGTYQSAATTTGLGLRLNGTATATAIRVWSTIWGSATSASTPTKLQLTALAGAHLTTATFAATTDYEFEIEGVIRVNAAGTLVLEFASEVAASQVTVQADAVLIATPLD